MSSEDDTPIEIQVTGLVTSVAYQKAKLCVERLHKHLPFLFLKPIIRGLLEFDWEEFIMKQRREYGHEMWEIKETVIISTESGYFRGCEKFLKEIATFCEIKLLTETADYYRPMLHEYVTTLRKNKRIYAFMEFTIDRQPAGSLVFQLYSDLLPITCENFKCLCTGEKGGNDEGVVLHYKNTIIHRVVKMGWLQGGDIENRTGGGGVSIYGRTFADEGYCVSHGRRGVLSMANDGRHSNGSQFIITLQPALWMDQYYVAFGQVVEGESTLRALETVDTAYERPLKAIEISNCGLLDLSELEEEPVVPPDRCMLSGKDKTGEQKEASSSSEESGEVASASASEYPVAEEILRELVDKGLQIHTTKINT